jgi:transposase-like protein
MHGKDWTIDEKLEIVMKGLLSKTSISEICREYKVNEAMYYKWRDRFIEGGKKGLERKNAKDTTEIEDANRKIRDLERIIGRLTVQNEILKKTEEILNGRTR